jgi:hypothetical protein
VDAVRCAGLRGLLGPTIKAVGPTPDSGGWRAYCDGDDLCRDVVVPYAAPVAIGGQFHDQRLEFRLRLGEAQPSFPVFPIECHRASYTCGSSARATASQGRHADDSGMIGRLLPRPVSAGDTGRLALIGTMITLATTRADGWGVQAMAAL